MKCCKCGKKCDELTQLTGYGALAMGCKDQKGYCDNCFNNKYPRLHERGDNEESDE